MSLKFSNNMTQIPKPELDVAIKTLCDRDEYKVIVDHIREERERCVADIGTVATPNEVMRSAGAVAALDYLLNLLSVKSH